MLSLLVAILFAAVFLFLAAWGFIQAERIRLQGTRPFGPRWMPTLPRFRGARPGSAVAVWYFRFIGAGTAIIGILFVWLIVRTIIHLPS
jgi:hypothetical protein